MSKRVSYPVIRVIHFSSFWEIYQKGFIKSYRTTLSNYTCYPPTYYLVYSHNKLRKWKYCEFQYTLANIILLTLKLLLFFKCFQYIFTTTLEVKKKKKEKKKEKKKSTSKLVNPVFIVKSH